MATFRPRRVASLTVVCIVALGIIDGAVRSKSFQDEYFPTELATGRSSHASRSHSSRHMSRHTLPVNTSQFPPHLQPCEHSFQCLVQLVCRDGYCGSAACQPSLTLSRYCQDNEQCAEVNTKNVCRELSPEITHCQHKTLFGHFDHSDLLIILITFLTTAMSAPAGTGGGGVLVPMYIIVGQFSPHGAIPLSKVGTSLSTLTLAIFNPYAGQATIFGGAIANNYFNLQRRHPRADRPLVDFRTVLLLEPLLLLGTVIGVFFNALSPGWLITVLLVGTLSFVTYRTVLKGISAYKTEMAEAREVVPEQVVATSEEERRRLIAPSELSQAAVDNPEAKSGAAMSQCTTDPVTELEVILQKEARPLWFKEIGVLCLAWIVIAVTARLKGGEGGAGVVPCGTFLYWCIVVMPMPIIGAIFYMTARSLIDDHERKMRIGFRFLEGDLHWNSRNTLRYPMYCFFAGFAAGALGIAAGTVLGPVLLELGMLPITATASSGFMVLFTASSTTTQFLIMGQLQLDYALFFAFIGLLGAGLGNTGVNWIVKRYRKTYFIIFMLAGIIGVSVVLMGITGALREIDAVKHGKSLGFRPLCHD